MARTNTNSGGGGGAVETLANGLTLDGTEGVLGGTLIENTAINIDEFTFSVGGQIDTDFTGGLYITDDFFGFGPIGTLMVATDPTNSNAFIQTGDVSAFGIGNTGESASMVAYLPGGAGITSYYLANSDGAFQTSTDGAGTTMQVFQTPTSYAIAGANPALESAGITIEPATGIDLLFGTVGDFRLDGQAGTAGETIISQGIGNAPIWGTPSVDTIYTADGTLTGAREVAGGGFSLSMIDFDGFTLSTGTGDVILSASQDNFLSATRDVYISGDNSTNINSSGATNINGGSIVIAPNNGDITLDTTALPSDIRLNSGKDLFAEFEQVTDFKTNAGNSYFSLDLVNDVFRLGDRGGVTNGLEFIIDNGNGVFSMVDQAVGSEYFRFDTSNFLYQIGDVGGGNNTTIFEVNDGDEVIRASANNGFQIDASAYAGSITTIPMKVSLSASQIRSGATTPINIGLPASGAGFYYRVKSFDVNFTYNGVQFDVATQLAIKDPSATNNSFINLAIAGTASTFDAGQTSNSIDIYSENSTLQIIADADSTVGDGTADVYIVVEKVAL